MKRQTLKVSNFTQEVFKMIRKILCPTDLSANSKAGVAYAISLARENQAELVVFYATIIPVYELAYSCEPNPFLRGNCVPRFTVDQLLRDATSKVSHFFHANFGDEIARIQWKPKAGLGKVAREIVTAACQEEADLIVMAKKKKRPLSRLLSRSISEAVSREAPCPVLSVCPPQIVRPWRGRQMPLVGGVLRGSEA
jgi:nucleotide-binding universal stress UspA family protein